MSDGSSQRATGSGLDGFDALWGAMRPFAISLRDVIMLHSPSSIPSTDGTSAASPVIIPSVQNRRAACTHLTMERLYGDYECMVCHRPSAWGWLYSCSQDDSEDDFDPAQDRVVEPSLTTADLAPWIQDAIAKGHYTEAQVEKMDAFIIKVISPDIYENDPTRPLSDPDVLRTLGLRKAKAGRPPLRTFDSMGIYTINAQGQLALSSGNGTRSTALNNLSADVADQKAEADSKGFRDSVKRAFKGMLISRKRDSGSSKYSRGSSRKKRIPDDGSAEFDLSLWRELSEELLREAARIPLPGHDGKDGLEAEEDEVEVEDGVAVTEEAVDLGTADIIMSV
ncbi:MAG: hypothetical protein Q9185_004099 [Variospora sp. 1 TL-2023]